MTDENLLHGNIVEHNWKQKASDLLSTYGNIFDVEGVSTRARRTSHSEAKPVLGKLGAQYSAPPFWTRFNANDLS